MKNIIKKNKITRIAVAGAMGRMGQMLIKTIQKNKNTSLSAAIVETNHPLINQDIGECIGIGKINTLITSILEIKNNNFDVLIDFTNSTSTIHYLKYCEKFKKNIVIGTTGFSDKEIDTIKSYSNKIAVIMSSNFSIGINLLYKLVEKATKIIGNETDIDIIEFHHRNKMDIPSGTALSIGKKISNIINLNLDNNSLYYKKGIRKTRETKKIGFSSIRSGETIGKHSAIFLNAFEEIKITHTAFTRESFSQGAIEAAIWLHKKRNGFFSMQNVLENKF